MEKPSLVIMAAGMGSRYGGIKQLDPIGENGELIIDYSLYDARRAGFESAVCVIRKETEKDFKAHIDRGAARFMDIKYAYQDINELPAGRIAPQGRSKPWGTGHAVLSAKDKVKTSFAAVNADDYYGPESFKAVYDFLTEEKASEIPTCCLVGFSAENTLSENGTVSRGICETDSEGFLTRIEERLKLRREGNFITDEGSDEKIKIPLGTPVSMNLFGFPKNFMGEFEKIFEEELDRILRDDPLKGEFFLPCAVQRLMEKKRARVKLLSTPEKWYGMTYLKDKETVKAAMREKTAAGLYPQKGLWT